MGWSFNHKYPSIQELRRVAKRKVPKFAFEYLESGCNEEVNLHRNTAELREVLLKPSYLNPAKTPNLNTNIFGITYDAPFGIAPIGLQGLIWPNASQILAKAAAQHNVPFILSTVATASIEEIGQITAGKAWFQLYHPVEESLLDDLINRVERAGFPVLVLLCDVPTFGYRHQDIKNGLSMPPKMSINNLIQILKSPDWAWNTLKFGQPKFETLLPYMPKNLNLSQLGNFMNKTFDGNLHEERIAKIRDKWKGKLVLKGVATKEDTLKAIRLGVDGIIVSNHGGRQLDAGESTIQPMSRISEKYGDKITVMMDSGIRSGPDIARSLASGAKFSFLGRSFMYGVGALGQKGGDHTIAILKTQLKQVMEQVGCHETENFPDYLS